MFDDLEKIGIVILWSPYILLALVSLVALIRQRFWIPAFVHIIAYAGAIVTFLVVLTIPRGKPYNIGELLMRLLLFPAGVYGVYIIFGGPLKDGDETIDIILDALPDGDDPQKDRPWFIIFWIVYIIISIIFFR